jgi:hypothetical protein
MDEIEHQPQEGSEAGEASERAETQGLDDATLDPHSYIEQQGDYKQSEEIQQEMTSVLDNTKNRLVEKDGSFLLPIPSGEAPPPSIDNSPTGGNKMDDLEPNQIRSSDNGDSLDMDHTSGDGGNDPDLGRAKSYPVDEGTRFTSGDKGDDPVDEGTRYTSGDKGDDPVDEGTRYTSGNKGDDPVDEGTRYTSGDKGDDPVDEGIRNTSGDKGDDPTMDYTSGDRKK